MTGSKRKPADTSPSKIPYSSSLFYVHIQDVTLELRVHKVQTPEENDAAS